MPVRYRHLPKAIHQVQVSTSKLIPELVHAQNQQVFPSQ